MCKCANSNPLFQNNSVILNFVIWFRGVALLMEIQNCGCIMFASFYKPEIVKCISCIISWLAGAIGGVSEKGAVCSMGVF